MLNLWFRNLEVISQLGDDLQLDSQLGGHFAAKGQFRSPFFRVETFSQPISQLRNGVGGLRNGTRVPKGCFAAAKWAAKFSLSFARLSSNGLTSSFQLRFAHRLKRWTSDFSIFETTYNMHKMDSRKYSKSVQKLLSSWITSC